jgi:DNA-directed RNA polymerase delta subunit
MRTLRIEEITYKRLTSVLEDVMHYKKKDVNYDDILNELIDVYQENVGGSIGGTIGGG